MFIGVLQTCSAFCVTVTRNEIFKPIPSRIKQTQRITILSSKSPISSVKNVPQSLGPLTVHRECTARFMNVLRLPSLLNIWHAIVILRATQFLFS